MRNGEGEARLVPHQGSLWAFGALRALGSAISNPAPISRPVSVAANSRQTSPIYRHDQVHAQIHAQGIRVS